jgi:membrane-associated phospholipid phosphatase
MKSVRSHEFSGFDLLGPVDELFPFDDTVIETVEVTADSPFEEWCSALFSRLDPREAEVVRQFRAVYPAVHAAARLFNDAGVGWIYPILVLMAILFEGADALAPTGCAALSIAVAQSAFPFIKKRIRRERPLAFDPTLQNGVRPLDRWAWPSGHSIAASAFAVPFVLAGLIVSLPIMICAVGVAWSRVALGHHYPTDVLGGVTLGTVVGSTCWIVLA